MLIGREQEQEMLHKASQIAHSLLQCMVEDVWARPI